MRSRGFARCGERVVPFVKAWGSQVLASFAVQLSSLSTLPNVFPCVQSCEDMVVFQMCLAACTSAYELFKGLDKGTMGLP